MHRTRDFRRAQTEKRKKVADRTIAHYVARDEVYLLLYPNRKVKTLEDWRRIIYKDEGREGLRWYQGYGCPERYCSWCLASKYHSCKQRFQAMEADMDAYINGDIGNGILMEGEKTVPVPIYHREHGCGRVHNQLG